MHIVSFTEGMEIRQDEDLHLACAAEKGMAIHCGNKQTI